MHEIQADSWGIAELNLDTQRSNVKEILHRTTRRQYDFAKMTFGSSSIPSRRHDYKPGGTLLASQGHITSRILHQDSDYMGRWSYQVLNCRQSKTITLISAYQVCNQGIASGDNRDNRRIASYTTTAQQTSMLRQEDEHALQEKRSLRIYHNSYRINKSNNPTFCLLAISTNH